MNEIRANLWITDMPTVRETSFDHDAVVTVCQEDVYDNVSTECYVRFNMADGPHNSYGGDCSYEMFDAAVKAVVSLVENGRKTLVHCHHGKSRSAAVCMAATAILDGLTFEQARGTVTNARQQASPDPTLIDHAKRAVGSLK